MNQQRVLTMFRWVMLMIGLGGIVTLSATDYNESADGDLSGDRLSPTQITLSAGANVISASTVWPDVDYFTVTVPPDHELTAINLTSYAAAGAAFLAFQEGSTFTEPVTTSNIGAFLGWTHLDLPLEDKLPVMAQAFGVIGYTAPLGPGTYTFWAQETSANPSAFELDFVVTSTVVVSAIPTLSEWMIVILALGMMIAAVVVMRVSAEKASAPSLI